MQLLQNFYEICCFALWKLVDFFFFVNIFWFSPKYVTIFQGNNKTLPNFCCILFFAEFTADFFDNIFLTNRAKVNIWSRSFRFLKTTAQTQWHFLIKNISVIWAHFSSYDLDLLFKEIFAILFVLPTHFPPIIISETICQFLALVYLLVIWKMTQISDS